MRLSLPLAALLGFSGALLGLTACQPSVDKAMEQIQASKDAEDSAMAVEAGKNLEAGKAFLAKIAKEPGVITLPSGLMYKVVSSPNPKAAKPTINDTVAVMYEGRLIDGKVFDSSYERGEPAQFPVNQVVPGWQEGIPLMHKGDTYMLYVPADLGYGDRRTPGDKIPPNSALVFKVELLAIQGEQAPSQGVVR